MFDFPERRRVASIRRAMELAKGDLRGICFEHVERILEMAAAEQGDGRLQVPGLDIWRSFDWIRIAPPADDIPISACRRPLRVDSSCPDGSPVTLELIESSGEYNCVYNEECGSSRLGDRSDGYSCEIGGPATDTSHWGRTSGEKLKDLFQEARIPLWERRNWPILTIGDEIVWARRFGPALNTRLRRPAAPY